MRVLHCAVFGTLMSCALGAMAQLPPDRWPATPNAPVVQIYGVLDTGVEYLDNTNAARASVVRVPTLTGMVPSNVGLRGSEDLGGGLKAVFNLENGIGVDNGMAQNGGRLFGRAAWVGLQGRFGTLMLGRQLNMTYIANLQVNIMGPAIHNFTALDPYFPNARSDNAIGYLGKFQNVSVGATYSTGRDASGVSAGPAATNCAGEVPGDSQACRQFTALLGYYGKVFGIGTSYDKMHGGNAATAGGMTRSDYTDRRMVLNGYVMIGAAKLAGGIVDRRTALATETDSRIYFAGLSYPLAPRWVFDTQIGRLDVARSPNDSCTTIARMSYAFSRRTMAYVSLAHMRNEGKAALSVSAGGTVGPGLGQNGLMIGLRHAF
ncbi:MAG: porin [Telluria sp.]